MEYAECGKCGVWKMRGVENTWSVESEECGICGVWKIWSVESAECGKCGVWKMRSVEYAGCGKCENSAPLLHSVKKNPVGSTHG